MPSSGDLAILKSGGDRMTVIEMRGVTKRYGETEALRGLDLSVSPGEVVCFLGPNGAGKTTALHVMLGLRRPSSGEAKLFGVSPRNRAARERVGVMLQESGVPTNLTVEELVRLFGRYYPYTLALDELLNRADLEGKRREQVRKLSGGQKQRLYFALALAGDPDLIFLDEPTAAMDVEARRAFWEQIRGLAALGKTVLFSTHYLEEADAVASRIVVIHEGRVIAEGSPREIKRIVAEKTARFKTELPTDRLPGYADVQRAETVNGYAVVYTNEPERLLAALFREGHRITELTVTDTELEAAFVSLTRKEKEEVPA
jgi:ABC-2 type transport system ATP-binding protein